jgi:hypothetical protein
VTATTAELNKLDGVTATTAELNILDGVTATAAELNKLDGVTTTANEFNFVDGVTSGIQGQLDARAPLASPTFTGTVSIPTLSLNGTNITASAAELNIMNGITASTVELNYTDGVTSDIQTQLNAKAPTASPTFTGTVATSSFNLGGNIVTDIATQAQAEAGTLHSVVMTPLRTVEAMAGREFGAVGSYALLGAPPGGGTGVGAFTGGSVYSGTLLGRAALFDEDGNEYMGMTVGSAMGGSWRLMGSSTSGSRDRILGIFLRVS